METEPSQHFTISIYNKMNNLIFEREASCTLTEAIILKDESIEFFKQSNEGSIFQPGEWYIRSSMEGSVKMSAKITMEYAQNMISNLRAQFKEAHKVEFNGTDQQVLDILNSDIVAPTAAEQDEWYVDYMWSVHSNNLIKGV